MIVEQELNPLKVENSESENPNKNLSVLKQALQYLPEHASEADVEDIFSKPFLNALGFEDSEIVPQFPIGRRLVDRAARKNNETDLFRISRTNPCLYMEVKGRDKNLAEELHSDYLSGARQLKQYLVDPKSKSVKWGILTNSRNVQVFRKHGKVVHPVTPCLSLHDDTDFAINNINNLINDYRKALTIAVYNNKGGVGKTTTTLNLAATLSMQNNRVLVVDFDPNQSDLGDSLNLPPLQGKLLNILKNKDSSAREIITNYRFKHPRMKLQLGFDVILADESLVCTVDGRELSEHVKINALRRLLESVRNDYDYILIDAPPNWRIFSQMAIYAADVVLIPARHDNLHSLQNAGMAIARFIPEINEERKKRGESGPIALPIFMNNAFKISGPQLALMHQAIEKIIRETKREIGFNLKPYYYPKSTPGKNNTSMNYISYMAHISKADFLHVPAAFVSKRAQEQYLNLAKEYFIQ